MAERNQFGKYELQARLAAGGMAEIFKARYPVAAGISKQVVIKRILPHYAANKQFISMFTNEARIVMGFSHGNIAQVFDFGEIDGDWFIAMEYVDGQPLSKIIKRARTVGIQAIPTSFAVLVTIEMLKGLQYAHTRLDEDGKPLRIVHRDVSPQNVLVSFEGQVKIVDFGIAKAKTAGREETESGAVKGKYSYFSPEQARGKEVDARTDVFAAGIVLYEMLCGRLPFVGKMIQTMSQIVKGQFAPPRELNPEITPALEQIILTAMAHERDKRYPSAEAFQSALSSYLYQNAPSFQVSSLGTFLQLLFEPDLVADGRPVKLPREFLDQVSLWKKPLPNAPVDAPIDTAWGKDPTKSGRKLSEHGLTAETSKPMPRAIRWVLLGLAGAIGTGLVVAGHSIYKTTGAYKVELSSTPVGAQIAVDGRAQNKKTPATVTLEAGTHTLELSYAGMRDWSRAVTRERDDTVSMHAELEPMAGAPAPVEELTVDAGAAPVAQIEPVVVPPTREEVPMNAALPDLVFEVNAKAHATRIPETKAARLKLNPARTYKVWTEGKASLGGMSTPIMVTDVAYFVQGGAAKDSYGVLTPKPQVIKGATMLYAFLLDNVIFDNSGAIKVKVKDLKGSTETLSVDALSNAVELPVEQRMTYSGFNSLGSYQLRLLEKGPLPRTRGAKGGDVRKVLVTQAAGFNTYQNKATDDVAVRQFELGKVYKVHGTSYLWLTFPDDDPSDNDGKIEVEIIQTSNPLGGLRIPLPGANGTAFGH